MRRLEYELDRVKGLEQRLRVEALIRRACSVDLHI